MFSYQNNGMILSGHQILSPLQLTFNLGETHCLIGPSGCGKSSLLNQMAGLSSQTDVVGWGEKVPEIGYLFQQPRLLPWRTILENLLLVEPNQSLVLERLSEVKLVEYAKYYPNEISLGMARRVALARCLLLEPDIILMDEPLTSLDLPTAKEMRELIIRLVCEHPTRSMLYVTHDLDEALQLGDTISVLGGKPAQVIHSTSSELVSREDLEVLLKY
jgi:ABC-type nitrate/sulfonate/bicarbonate transport system ATPase subunit